MSQMGWVPGTVSPCTREEPQPYSGAQDKGDANPLGHGCTAQSSGEMLAPGHARAELGAHEPVPRVVFAPH